MPIKFFNLLSFPDQEGVGFPVPLLLSALSRHLTAQAGLESRSSFDFIYPQESEPFFAYASF